jgi:diaminopimelate epimerase
MNIIFYKYQGTGNDFIIIDNREGKIDLSQKQVNFLCDRRFGIGADGLMLLNIKEGYDFEMKYYNADGRESSMCGNGGRCLTKFAYDRGIQKKEFKFIAIDGEHEAVLNDNGWIHLKMKDVHEIHHHSGDAVLNTGSPHLVKQVTNIKHTDVYHEGHAIRYSKAFSPDGLNVNFVESLSDTSIYVRTYERGVEDETYSCGTGVTACALVLAYNNIGFNHVDIQTKGGELAVEFDKEGDNEFKNVCHCGPATFVFSGEIKL